MELPVVVFGLLLAVIMFLVLLVLGLLRKLRKERQRAIRLVSASAMPLSLHSLEGLQGGLHRIVEHGDNDSDISDSDRLSYITAMDELEKTSIVLGPSKTAPRRGMRRPRQNQNEVWHYRWTESLLEDIANGNAIHKSFVVETKERATPLFLMAGLCPNVMCKMQVLMFCQLQSSVDFWWVKPDDSGLHLQNETLSKHTSGRFKNSSDKVRQFMPLAEKFSRGVVDGEISYGISTNGRAFIDLHAAGHKTRMLVYLIWQEAWSMAAFGQKFIEGKICYQKTTPSENSSQALPLFARQYRIADGNVFIDPHEEDIPALLPPEPFQEMHEMAVT